MLDEIAGYMTANGIGQVFKARMPDTPDDAVCLYKYPGAPPEFSHDGQDWENLRLQVVVRGKQYDASRQKTQQVYDLLNGKVNEMIGSLYFSIRAMQSPFPLNVDSNERYRMAVNFEIARV